MSPRSVNHVYHLAEMANFASIERGGLLSTNKLLDQAGLFGEDRPQLERQQRLRRTVLSTGVVIRDQLPMPSGALAHCLADGMQPSDWYALVNTMIFFWWDQGRLLRQARVCAPWPQVMIEIDAERLLVRYASSASVTPINVGNARRRPARRGRASFVPFPNGALMAGCMKPERSGSKRDRPRNRRPN